MKNKKCKIPDGKKVFVQLDSSARIIDLISRKSLPIIKGEIHNVFWVKFSNDGQKIVTCFYNEKIDELTAKIWDTKNQKWTDKSANDLGFFGSLFKEPLVYAQWEEDGVHEDPFTGLNTKHSKGEYKNCKSCKNCSDAKSVP